jgi:hypothetical protein
MCPRSPMSAGVLTWTLVLAVQSAALAQSRGLPRIEIAAGGGFVGIRAAEVASRPAVDCDPAGNCVTVPGFVDLLDNTHRVWRPALATGLVLRWSLEPKNDEDDKFGMGLGGQMVFTPQAEGTRLLPALTFHAGTRDKQLFVGLLFGSTDEVRFPGGASTVRVADGVAPSFIEPNRRHKPNLFFGIVIDGAAVLKK